MKKIGLLMATLPMLIAGCGGGGGALSAAGGSVTSAQVQAIFADATILNVLRTLEVTDNMGSPPVNDQIGGGLLDDPFASCTRSNKDTAVDADGDGIKKHLKYEYNCNQVNAGYGGVASRVGFYEVVDHNDEDAPENKGWGGGYRYTYEFDSAYKNAHEEMTFGYNGYFDVKNTGGSLIYDSKYKSHVDGEGTDDTGKQLKWSWVWQTNWKNVYTPDDMTQFYKAGNVRIEGFFKVAGSMTPNQTGVSTNVNVVFEVASKDLRYDRDTCPSYFWSQGEMSFKDGSGNVYKYVYSCGPAKAYYNGKEIVP